MANLGCLGDINAAGEKNQQLQDQRAVRAHTHMHAAAHDLF